MKDSGADCGGMCGEAFIMADDGADAAERFCCIDMRRAVESGYAKVADGVAVYGGMEGGRAVSGDGSVYEVGDVRGIRARRCLFCGSGSYVAASGRPRRWTRRPSSG